jgi:hypothetical protein
MLAAFSEIFEKCGHDLKKVAETGASDFGGCFNIRAIAHAPGCWQPRARTHEFFLKPSFEGSPMVANVVSDKPLDGVSSL